MDPISLRHWIVDTDVDNICWLTLDRADSTANTLARDVLGELGQILSSLSSASPPKGIVIRSGKPSGFIVGADVKEFAALGSAPEATELAAEGQALMGRIAELDCPTVALIRGFALGGGLELALACDYRIAAKGYERNLGLPEVQLGIHPGFGGTVRSVALLGAPLALDLMLTGRALSPSEALAAGLLDAVAEPGELDKIAVDFIGARPRRRKAAWYLRLLSLRPLRGLLAGRIRRTVAKRVLRAHYPAPYAIVDLWQRFGGRGPAAYRAEVESIGALLVTSTCRNLVRVFLLRERLRHLGPKEARIDRVHVVGAGVMGGDIAAWCALRGLTVTLQDRAMEYVTPALDRAKSLFSKRLKAPGAAAEASGRLQPDVAGTRAGSADLLIEAIVENREAKSGLFAALEPRLKDGAIIATNTSSIRLEDLAPALTAPNRFVGLHFFNPVAQLPLVEVIRGPQTDDATMRRAAAFVIQIGKLPLPCRSSPGFLVNRILMPYMLEALRAVEEGTPPETVDAAAKAFGMPMGPIELADRVGLDVAFHVAKILSAAFGTELPGSLERRVDAGELGVKTGRGFYEYVNGKPTKARDYPQPDADLEDRLVLALVNEAVACHADGIVEDADLVDAGVVFGTGFAPFTGGPIQYARTRDIDATRRRLETLAERFGPRFQPHEGWGQLATTP